MSNTTLSQRSGIVKLVLILFGVQLLFLGYVFYQSYEGRLISVNAQRSGCERGKKDRKANARGWRIAEGARRAEGQITVANNYRDIAIGLEARSRTDCSKAFPTPGIFP